MVRAFLEAIEATSERLLVNFTEAWINLLQAAGTYLLSRNPLDEARYFGAQLALDAAASAVLSFPSLVLIQFLRNVASKVIPPEWAHKVVRLDKAALFAIDALRVALAKTAGQFQQEARIARVSDRLGSWKGFKERVIRAIGNRTVSRLERLAARAANLTAAKFVQLVLGWLDSLVQFVVGVGGLFVAYYFLQWFEEEFAAKALSQSAPRKKTRLVGGGSMYRREPGGAKP